MYFLTELDPNADVKGSRDPLGFQPIWTALGRHLVAHLTTVTTSLRGFSVLLLGLELADRALESTKVADHDARERERLACFLRLEQIAGYSRYVVHGATDIRGINRVKRRLSEGDQLEISAADQHQILAEQRTYGLWGLYMSAARGSGLVEKSDARLTGVAREHVDAIYVRPLKTVLPDLVKRVRDGGKFDPRERDRQLGRTVANVLGPTRTNEERQFLHEALVVLNDGSDPTKGRQRALWDLLGARSKRRGFAWFERCNHGDVTALRDLAANNVAVSEPLNAILALEPLLASAEIMFNHVVGLGRSKRSKAVEELEREWGALRHLSADGVSTSFAEISTAVGKEGFERLSATLDALRGGDYGTALDQLLDHNDDVMKRRGGAGWIQRSGAELRARLFQHPVVLPKRTELPTLWRNSYFIDALRWVGADVAGHGHHVD